MHGGASPSGAAHGRFVHGRYVQDIPAALAERFEAGQTDPELTSLRSEIALLDARIGSLLSRLRDASTGGETAATWSALRAAAARLEGASEDARQAALTEVLELIDRGATEAECWSEIKGLVDTRRRLAQTEHRRKRDLDQMIDVGQLVTLLATVEATIRQYVTDPAALSSIADTLRERSRAMGLLGRPDAGEA